MTKQQEIYSENLRRKVQRKRVAVIQCINQEFVKQNSNQLIIASEFFVKSLNCTSEDRRILFLLREIQVFLALKSIHQVNYSSICCNLIDFVFAKESNHVQCEKSKK